MEIDDYAIDQYKRLCKVVGFTSSGNGVRTILFGRPDAITTFTKDELTVIGNERKMNEQLKELRMSKLKMKNNAD